MPVGVPQVLILFFEYYLWVYVLEGNETRVPPERSGLASPSLPASVASCMPECLINMNVST